MSDGWIKIYRQLWENPRSRDPEWVALWAYMLSLATHAPMDAIFEGKRITLQPGQFITGRLSIAEKTGIDRNKIERLINLFKIEQQIEQRTSNQNRLITVKNWELYQQNEQQIEQLVSNERATSEQPVSTNKNSKKLSTTIVVGDPQPPEEEKVYGDPEVNRVMEIIKERTGLPAVSGKKNRIHAKNLLKTFKKNYPEMDPVAHFEKLIDLTLKIDDKYHTPKANDLEYLYYHWQEIVTVAKQKYKKKNENLSSTGKPKGTL